MYATKKETDFNSQKLISLSSKSKKEFIKQFKNYNETNAKAFYFYVLTEIQNVVSVGDIDTLKTLIRLIDYICSVKNKVTINNYLQNSNESFRYINLIILACKHNRIKILKYLFDKDSKILNNLSIYIRKKAMHPNDEDYDHHNAFYYSIRSGNIELLATLISKWPGDYFTNNLDELDEILSKTYEELKLKNLPLTDEMKIFVENKLINLRFFNDNSKQIINPAPSLNVTERIEFVLENITLLKTNYLEVDESFLFIGKMIAKNIFILKRQLKSTYIALPWEEIEFCLVSFVSSYTNDKEINIFYQLILNKEKLLIHLENFANILKIEKKSIENMDISKLTELPKLKREEVVANIVKNSPLFEELYNDYKQIMDVYSLDKINSYIKLALSADAGDEEDQLIIIRALQVIGEYLKNTLESPKLSNTTSNLLLSSLPRNTRKIVADLRNSLSHAYFFSKRTEIEENANISFFTNIQNDIKKINIIINDILYNNRIDLIRSLLIKMTNSESINDIDEFNKVLRFVGSQKLYCVERIGENNETQELQQIEQLIEELSRNINNKTNGEKVLFDQIGEIIDFEKSKLANVKSNYFQNYCLLEFLQRIKIHENDIKEYKELFNMILEKIAPKNIPQSFKIIANLTTEILNSVTSRMLQNNLDEISRLVYEVYRIVNFDLSNVKWIENLKDKLNSNIYVDIKDEFNNKYKQKKKSQKILDNLLAQKISKLNNILNNNALSDQLIQNFPSYKTNKKLQAIIEMLMLDIMEILNNSKKKNLTDNLLFLDNDCPLLTGKNLRNYLAHGNALIDILLDDSSIAVISNAKVIITENVIKSDRKIGKLITSNKLRDKFNRDFATISNQDNMFVALKEGNLENLKNCIRLGADINSRSINSWTPLHFAANGPSLEVVKFVLDQNISINIKDNDGLSPLHIAAANGRKNLVEFFIAEKNVDVNDTDITNKTSLYYAAQNGYKDIVQVLLKNKARTSIKSVLGYSPLHVAIQNNYIEIVKILLEKEVNVDTNKKVGGFTPLYIAAENGFIEIVNLLLANKANINAQSDTGSTPLHKSAHNGHLEVVKVLISKGANVNATTVEGFTPLYLAAEYGHEKVVELLLENRANANVVDKTYNFAPLNYAARDGHKGMLNILLKANANVNTTTVEGMTPLLFAAANGHEDIVHLLIKNRASINAENNNGFTALHLSAQFGYKNIVRLLIKKGLKINAKNIINQTSLHIATSNGKREVVRILIDEGADINSIDNNGSTALHLGCINGHKDVVKILIKKGLKINARDKNKKTSLHLAVSNGCTDIIKTLLAEGSDVNSVDCNGLTALHLGAIHGDKTVVQNLIEKNANVNIKSNGLTPLHMAAYRDHKEVTNILISKGANIDAINNSGDTVLSLAVKNNCKEIVDILIAKGADINAEGSRPLSTAVYNGNKDIVQTFLKDTRINVNININIGNLLNTTLLHIAATNGHKHIVEVLLAKGANIEAIDTNGYVTPLFLAIKYNHKEIVEFLLEKKANINARSIDGDTPLHVAAICAYNDIVKVLLNNGANPNLRDNRNRTATEMAVIHGLFEIVKTLLEHKSVNIHDRANFDFTFLHIAAQEGHLEIVKYLIDKQADINAKNDCGTKPIHIAAREGRKNIVEYFINNGFDINDRGAAGMTILHYAAGGGQLEVTKYLIEQKVDINPKDSNGSTPLHIAAKHGYEEVVYVLLNNGAIYNAVNKLNIKPSEMTNNEHIINSLTLTSKLFESVKCNYLIEVENLINNGAFVNAKNTYFITLLHYAAWKGYKEIITTLLHSKANPNSVGKNGWTPLHYATKFAHLEIIKILLTSGAIYNARSDNGKTSLDFAEHPDIINLLTLITQSFIHVQNGDSKVINDINKLKDISTIKAIMNTRNTENKTLIIVAVHNDFPQINKLKRILQDDLSNGINMADVLLTEEKYEEALKIFQKVFERRRIVLGTDNPATLDIQEKIAEILYKQQNYYEALDLFDEIYHKQKETLGINNKDTLNTRSTIALILYRQGKYEEALNIFKDVCQKQREILGENDEDILNIETHMALVLDKLQKYEEALNMNYKVYQKRKKKFGINDPSTLVSQHNIAMILNNQGKHDEARKMYQNVYETRKRILGPNHSDTLKTLHDMVGILTRQQKYDEALKIFQEVYETQITILGPNHIDTLNTHVNIANILFSQGKWLGAYKIYKANLEPRKAILGPNNHEIMVMQKMMKIINLKFKCEDEHNLNILENIKDSINIAASNGDINVVKDLIENGIDVNTTDADGRTPLHFASDNGHKNIVEILLKSGADATKVTKKSNTPLHLATSKGFKEIVKILLQHVKQTNCDKFNNFINAKTTISGSTSMHLAAKNGFTEIVKFLLEYGAIYNCIHNNTNKTPLELSEDQNVVNLLRLTNELFRNAKNGNRKIISKLQNIKSDELMAVTNARNNQGNTLLQVAMVNKHKDIASKLLEILKTPM